MNQKMVLSAIVVIIVAIAVMISQKSLVEILMGMMMSK